MRLTEQVAPDDGDIDLGDIDIGESPLRIGEGSLVHAFAHCAGEGFFHLGIAQMQMADVAAFEHLREGQGLENIGLGVGGAIGVAAFRKAEPLPRDLQRRIDDRLVDDAHRGGRLGHAVDLGGDAVGARVPGSRRDDLDRLPQRLAGILPDEIRQWLGTEAIDEHRFMLAQHAHVEKFARRLDRDQQIDRRSRKARNGLEVDQLERIGDHLVAIVALSENRPDRQCRVALADHERFGEEDLHRIAVERCGLRPRDEAGKPKRRRQQRHQTRRRRARPCATRPFPQHFLLPQAGCVSRKNSPIVLWPNCAAERVSGQEPPLQNLCRNRQKSAEKSA